MRIKQIDNFEGYFISDDGRMFSNKSGQLKEMKNWLDGKKKYFMITLCNGKLGKTKKLIHRLVAEAFIPNPNKYPVVNHIDYNTKNNTYTNLEWCTTQQNNLHGFKRTSQVRNFKNCKAYNQGEFIGEYHSVAEASRACSKMFGVSYHGLVRNYKSKNIKLVLLNEDE